MLFITNIFKDSHLFVFSTKRYTLKEYSLTARHVRVTSIDCIAETSEMTVTVTQSAGVIEARNAILESSSSAFLEVVLFLLIVSQQFIRDFEFERMTGRSFQIHSGSLGDALNK